MKYIQFHIDALLITSISTTLSSITANDLIPTIGETFTDQDTYVNSGATGNGITANLSSVLSKIINKNKVAKNHCCPIN